MTPQEKQVSKAFSSYWKAHFSRGKGAFEKVLSFWHPDITAIGTGKDEIVKSYSGFKKFLKREFEEVNTTMPVRILWTKVQLQKDLALVLAETEVIVSKEKNIKMRFRQSSVFKKHKDKWLLYHIHGSIPASAQRENESFPIDGLLAKKEELEKEVAEKTADLLNKNRELEIEAALERVRTIAMGMHKSEDLLNVSEILYLELNKLGFDEMRNAMINIHNDENKTFINYDYSDVIGKSKTLLNFNTHPVMEKQIRQSRIANDAFSEAVYKGKDLEEWKEFRKKYGEKDDPRIDKINALYYYFYSIGSGTIGISTFSQINEEKLTLLKRFRNVFSLAYQRYSDIALAEAQAREAQIELGLERVRARAMAMHKSEELNDVVMTLFDQMKDLEIDIDGININILNDDLTGFDSWFAAPGYTKAVCLYTPYFDTPAMNDIFNAVKNKCDLLSKIYPKEEKDAYFTYLYEHSDYKNLPHERKKMILDAESWCLSVGIANNTGISIHSYTGKTFSEKEHDILKRFAKVFSQTYTRFLDLQKAEAQAREAQIEAALERVRSRTMAMQKSEDLNKAASDMFKQIQVLGMQPWGCGFNIFDKDEKAVTQYMSLADGGISPPFRTPLNEDPFFISIYDARQRRDEILVMESKGESLAETYRYMFGLPGSREIFGDLENSGFEMPKFQITHCAYFSQGYLVFITYAPVPEAHDIFKRFAKVFDQTYTRFLDLQKAEAQAREAQIEAALERVRSRTMGMQRSDELQDAAVLLFQQVVALEVPAFGSGFNIWDDDRKFATAWMAGQDRMQPPFKTSSSEDIFLRIYNAAQKGESLFVEEQGREALKLHYDYMNSIPVFKEIADKMASTGQLFPTFQIMHCAFFSHGYLMFISFEPVPDAYDIFKRFAKVFEQTYTRFLDLQKAEAQARESQIEAALERVRSRTMAMQQSDELAETASVVFKQLITLGIEPNRIYIVIIKDDNGLGEFWITDEDGSKVSSGFTASLNDNRAFQKMFKGWKEKKKSITLDMQGEELQEYFRYLTSINVPFKGGLSQKRRLQYISYFSKGFIGVASPDEMKPETSGLLERFAAVFNLTYTRFNDLQQAEAQNKIIQAENERKTKELEEARELQLAMLPKEIPEYPGLDIKVYMQTATEVGGDYYDFSFRDDGSINIAIGDATGHGMKAGTLVTMMKSLFTANSSNKNIEEFFTSSNAAIKNSNLKRMMAGFAMINIKDHKAKYINAAMPPVYHYKKKESKVEEIKQHNLPLGAMKIEKYNATEINLNIGDVLIMMSDGFPELHNPADELFGYERVFSSFEKAAEAEPVEIIRYLNEESARWTKDKELEDDVTFVVIKIK